MRENIKFIILFVLVLALGGLVSFYSVKSTSLEKIRVSEIHTSSTAEIQNKNAYYKINKELEPKVSAKSFIVGDLDTGEIILNKDENTVRPIASVSKLMTALIAQEQGSEMYEAIVSKEAVSTYGQNGNLKTGDRIKTNELIYPLLLESSNDAAEVLAEFIGRDVFIDQMNKKAKALGLKRTTFSDPSGLSEGNQSTASDIFKLTRKIKDTNGNILDISKTGSRTYGKHTWSSNNQFLKTEGYAGGKSGYTIPAGQTVVSLFNLPVNYSIENKNIGIVLLGSLDRYKDVTALLKFIKQNIAYGKEGEENKIVELPKIELPVPVTEDPVSTATPQPQKQETPETEAPEPDFITLSFLGDMMLDRGVESSVRKNFGGDYSILFEKMNGLKESDIVFANLEGPASDQGKDLGSLYSFRMDPTVIPALHAGGINIVSVANNHMGDYGKDAFEDTLARLRENEILYTGGGEDVYEAEAPTVFEKNGIRLGFLGFSDVGPDWMTAGESRSGILSAKNPRYEEIIKNASSAVDYLIVSFHWGDEYKTIHNIRQESLAHRAIDSGAKLVIGHHPHVIQDTEVYKDGFIAYSLGNFIFDQYFSAETMQGLWLKIKLYKNGSIETTENIVKLNRLFKPETIELGKERKI